MSRTTTSQTNPLKRRLRGYVCLASSGLDGFAVGGISNEPESLARPQRGTDTVTNLKRARAIPREFHDWELPSEAQPI